MEAVVRLLEDNNRRGGFLLQFPDYRPDLWRNLAHTLGLTFLDYRAEVMAKLGWDAHTLSLHELDRTLIEHSVERGLVAYNVEALLATKPTQPRTEWLQRFVDRPSPHAVIVPLCIYTHEAPASHPRCFEIKPDLLPAESFVGSLTRLAKSAQS